jgi:hypothetical protein
MRRPHSTNLLSKRDQNFFRVTRSLLSHKVTLDRLWIGKINNRLAPYREKLHNQGVDLNLCNLWMRLSLANRSLTINQRRNRMLTTPMRRKPKKKPKRLKIIRELIFYF